MVSIKRYNAPKYIHVETGGDKRSVKSRTRSLSIIIASGTQANQSEDAVLIGQFGAKLKPLICIRSRA